MSVRVEPESHLTVSVSVMGMPKLAAAPIVRVSYRDTDSDVGSRNLS